MLCPVCGREKNYVTDARPCKMGMRRRRECENCGARFTTYEYQAGYTKEMEYKTEQDILNSMRHTVRKWSVAIEKVGREDEDDELSADD